MRPSFLLTLAILARAASARGEPEKPQPPRQSRALPTAAAVVPGLVVHGAGHYARGETATAKNLLLMEGIGLGLFLGGGVTLFATGASRYFVAPAATAAITGFGLFSTSYLADIYGTVSRDGDAALSRQRPPARFETELGYRRVYDPEFAYTDFMVERISRQIGSFRLSPSGWFSRSRMHGSPAGHRRPGRCGQSRRRRSWRTSCAAWRFPAPACSAL